MNRRTIFKFRLYVAGDAENSAKAVANLTALCHERLAARHEIEVVDVFREPVRALADHILMTPTLIKMAPFPLRRIVGTLSQSDILVWVLGLDASAR